MDFISETIPRSSHNLSCLSPTFSGPHTTYLVSLLHSQVLTQLILSLSYIPRSSHNLSCLSPTFPGPHTTYLVSLLHSQVLTQLILFLLSFISDFYYLISSTTTSVCPNFCFYTETLFSKTKYFAVTSNSSFKNLTLSVTYFLQPNTSFCTVFTTTSLSFKSLSLSVPSTSTTSNRCPLFLCLPFLTEN
ncbi:hypothetical protein ACF0H5_023311 [Mactra antiquata]